MPAEHRTGPVLHTPRLALRPLDEGDAPELLALFNDPVVGRYLLDGEPVSPDWVASEIADSTKRFQESGAGLWGVRERRGSEILGFAGYRTFFEPPELQLLYGLRPAAHGRGLATEAAGEVVRHGFLTLGFDVVRAATDRPNEASVRVLERLGFALDRESEDGQWGTLFYSLEAPPDVSNHASRIAR